MMRGLTALLVILLAASAAADKGGGGGDGISLEGLLIAVVLLVVGFFMLSYRNILVQIIGLILVLIGIIRLIQALL